MFFDRVTEGIRISAQPFYVPEHSDVEERRHVFVYQVRIENVGDQPAQLLWRHWYIHDPVGGDSEVEGEGVVGEKPLIGPGEVHEYQSFCVLQCTSGHMEGYYEFRRPDGSVFKARVPRFLLRVYEA
ncbi:MAG TPA: Co2+/Mg2+ efflux protein ApaG [Longimicrobiaceae bacterium]|nr:Co2+/Mg2+ efflux protein ApaG [Longimicrobiaceae bacterium]